MKIEDMDDVFEPLTDEFTADAVDEVASIAGLHWARLTDEDAVRLADAMIQRLQAERDAMQRDVDAYRRN